MLIGLTVIFYIDLPNFLLPWRPGPGAILMTAAGGVMLVASIMAFAMAPRVRRVRN